MAKTLLVVPTCRPESIGAFFAAWGDRGGWDAECVVEDTPARSAAVAAVLPAGALHYSHAEIDADLGENAWVISRRDSAVRAYGFLVGHRLGMDVLTLDDDCFPARGGYGSDGVTFAGCHRTVLRHPRWVASVPKMRTRGLPYRNLSELEAKINIGLWEGVPDLDGPQGLLHPTTNFVPPRGSRLVPAGQYVPVCGMNLYVRHAAIPLMYFALMGEGQPYRRFDDIWGGVIAKRALDALGWHLSVGEPWVHHRRASDPFANLVKEAPGLAANETFWEAVDAAPLWSLRRPSQPVDVMAIIGEYLFLTGNSSARPNPYLARLGEALKVWARLCSPATAGKE